MKHAIVVLVLFASVTVLGHAQTIGAGEALGASVGTRTNSTTWGLVEEGMASWYGEEFAGRSTSNGEIFDPAIITAAHRSLPFGSMVKVTNLSNGLSIMVRINDRGPFKPGRIIDLSKAAAEQIGLLAAGVAKVRIETSSVPGAPAQVPLVPQVAAWVETRSIQVMALSTIQSADTVIQHLAKNQVQALIEPTSNGKYRIVVAKLALDQVDPMVDRLAQLGYTGVLVRKN